jgi:quercetin dioxygenase-like cupin family protein
MPVSPPRCFHQKNSEKTASAQLLFPSLKLRKPRISAKVEESLAVNFPDNSESSEVAIKLVGSASGLTLLDPGRRCRQALPQFCRSEAIMGASAGPGIVLQPDEGESYWQPVWANGYSTIKVGPKDGVENLTMGVQVIAPGGYVREHSHTPNQEILFCFAGKGTIIVDGVAHPFVPGTTVYAGPGVRHKIINDGPDELKMTWTYLPPGLNEFFAEIGRPRRPGEPAPEPFARPAEIHTIEARTGYGPPIEG